MKRSDLSTELKDWAPGVYSTLEAQLQLIVEYLDVEFSCPPRLSYFADILHCSSLGIFDKRAVRNLAIMLRIYTLKIANSSVKLQDVFCQVAAEFSMGKCGVASVYYNSESLQSKKLAECYVKFHKENFVN